MIFLKHDRLEFSFPEVHEEAKCYIELMRTLRIPDDGKNYPLPPGLGRFPLRHVDDFACRLPGSWLERGGVMLPMYQSEAMWIHLYSKCVGDRDTYYPFAVKIATGKINAVTGETWSNGLSDDPQDYMVIPKQPWLDGYVVEKGFIRQFVAMPLGSGYSAEEQITGEAEHGGIQIIAYPMRRKVFEQRFPVGRKEGIRVRSAPPAPESMSREGAGAMGLAPGGRMKQEIYTDPYGIDDWDAGTSSRCFIAITNSLMWRSITGDNPPTVPPTAEEYTRRGLPWFDYYDDATAVDGTDTLKGLKSVVELGVEKGDAPLPENESVTPHNIVAIRKNLKENQVREGKM